MIRGNSPIPYHGTLKNSGRCANKARFKVTFVTIIYQEKYQKLCVNGTGSPDGLGYCRPVWIGPGLNEGCRYF
jgi:hypothetical protein